MKKLLCITLCFVIALCSFSLIGCGKDDGKTKIRLCEVAHSIFYAPMYVAINEGFFSDEGIEIELTNGGGADKVMTALTSGSADVGLMGPEATVYCQAQNKKDYPIIFAQLTKRDGSFLVAKTNQPNFKWSDLRGKHVLAGRVGGVPAMTMQYVVNEAGLDEQTDLNFNTSVAFNMMGPVFESDDSVDYTTLFEPTASEFQASGKGYIVASVGEASGEIPYTSFSVNKSYLNKNRDLLLKFLRAIKKGYEFIKTSTPEKIAGALSPSFEGVSDASIVASINSYIRIDAWKEDLFFTEEAYIKLQAVMENAGFLESRVTYTSAVDNSLVNEINAKN